MGGGPSRTKKRSLHKSGRPPSSHPPLATIWQLLFMLLLVWLCDRPYYVDTPSGASDTSSHNRRRDSPRSCKVVPLALDRALAGVSTY
eukprot:3881375-Pyramimonas_sp.AAC.1